MPRVQPALFVQQQALARGHGRQVRLQVAQLRIAGAETPATGRQPAGDLHHLAHTALLDGLVQLGIDKRMTLQQETFEVQSERHPCAPADRRQQAIGKAAERGDEGGLGQPVAIPDVTGVVRTGGDMGAVEAGSSGHDGGLLLFCVTFPTPYFSFGSAWLPYNRQPIPSRNPATAPCPAIPS
ncbi:hypothetical protein D3C76_1203520 [compost metagenome]